MSDRTLPLGKADPTERREARREKVHCASSPQAPCIGLHGKWTTGPAQLSTLHIMCLHSSADRAAAPVLAQASDKMADDRGRETVEYVCFVDIHYERTTSLRKKSAVFKALARRVENKPRYTLNRTKYNRLLSTRF